MTRSRILLPEKGDDVTLTTHQKRLKIGLRSELSAKSSHGGGETVDEDSSEVRGTGSSMVKLDEPQALEMTHRHASSTWPSAVSEARYDEPISSVRISSFAKMTVLGERDNLTGTADGSGAREVQGSSLAGDSSPRESFPATPPNFSTPSRRQLSPGARKGTPIAGPKSAVTAFHRLLELENASSIEKPRKERLNRDSFAWFQKSQCHPSPHDTTPLSPPKILRHQLRLQDFTRVRPSRSGFEKRVSVLQSDVASNGDLASVNWSKCLPPIGPERDRSGAKHSAGLRRIYILHPEKATPSGQMIEPTLSESLETYQKHLSQYVGYACLLLPILGPVFGHGGLDVLINWHSKGQVTQFRRQEKGLILAYSYGMLVIAVIALTLAMVLFT
ncbi:uncharacterized protein KY384_001537 [Bacidia gigantensis]|uniref:uncharacterized protein n=1 Tax=Bacidia gigantensis TaxID=2732470 RepID=UPI001D0589E8|nr:uncharacterized protein KY384_001537 [Bacidia gigantensis]KAG8533796.1 hypothetical protein KY384_001537 [Bacidia gigantensis]